MKTDKDLIEQMVQETFNLKHSDEKEVIFQSDGHVEIPLVLDQERSCLYFYANGDLLEIPTNWGPFKGFEGECLELTSDADSEHLLESLSLFMNRPIERIVFTIHRNLKSSQFRFAA